MVCLPDYKSVRVPAFISNGCLDFFSSFVWTQVRGAVEGANASSTEQITHEVLTMMDRIYYSLVAMTKNSTNVTDLAVPSKSTAEVLTDIKGSGALLAEASNFFSWSVLMNYGYAHFETLYSVRKLTR